MKVRSLQFGKALSAALFVLLLSVAGMKKMYAYDFSTVCSTGQTLYYKIIDATNHKVMLTCPNTPSYSGCYYGFTRPTGDIILPETVQHGGVTYSVTSIGNYTFYECRNLTGALIIPSTVVTIGDYAFFNCNSFTGSLSIPNTVTTIGEDAFSRCSGFTGDLIIGNAVTTIGKEAFSYCKNFTGSLTIGNAVTSIGNFAFTGCSGFTGDLVIPNSVTKIGGGAFSDCRGFTGSLTFGDSLTSIGNTAFSRCSGFTGTLVIPNSLDTIAYGVFQYCSGFTGTLTIPNSVTTIQGSAFSNCSGFTGELIIPNSVITIEDDNFGSGAFGFCRGLTSLVLGNSLTMIGKKAFMCCNGLTGNLVIPNSVTNIGNSAFSSCSGFTGNLVIPDSVTNIGSYAFSSCSGLTGSLTIGNSVTTISDDAFYYCTGFTGSLVIPSSVVYLSGFKGCIGFTGELIIPNSVTEIGAEAFSGCSGFTGSLTISNSVTEIGYNAFSGCSGFTGDLVIPNSVTTIGNEAFYGCNGFTGNLIIGNSVTTISDEAFYGCNGFTGNLTIGNSVTTIGSSAFNNCWGFTGSLTLPNSLTEIGSSAFYECRGFTGSLTIGNSVIQIGDGAFSSCWGFTGDLVIPNSVTTIGNYAFSGAFSGTGGIEYIRDFTGNLTIGNSVVEIGESAFSGCGGFTGDLVIPNTVTNLGFGAFSYCTGFTGSLTIGNSVTEIPYGTFEGCSFTGELTLGNSVTTIYNGNFDDCGFIEIHSKNINPPGFEYSEGPFYYKESEYNVFNVDYSIPVYVPCGTQEIYSNAPGWSEFTNYQETPPTITVMANPESFGYAYIDQYGTCESPESIVYAYPYNSVFTYSSYEFINWTVDGEEVSTSPYYTFELTEDITLVANFGPGSNHVFVGGYSNLWSDVENWMPQVLPAATSTIEIHANMEVDGEASAANVNIAEGKRITILPEGIFNVTGSLYSSSYWWGDPFVVIEDGGQLYHPNGGIFAMVKKAITPYTPGTKNGWHLITNSLYYSADFYDMETLFDNEYDLYYYDEPTYYWMNQKDSDNEFYYFQNGKGYLYANSGNVTLEFVGEPRIGSASVNVPLSYTETAGDLKGFNLVGNPFVHNITSYASENVANGCFVMNPAKDNLIVSEISETNPLKPTEGFFVKATAEGASITFNPQRGKANAQQGTISMELTENRKLIDRLIVKREGEPLEKLSLNNSRTKLFVQGEQQELAIVPCKGNEQLVCFKAAKDGTYTIHVNVDGMEFDYLHLIDNLTGMDVDLLAKPDYTFTAKTTDYTSRFKLVFSTNANNASNNNK